MKHNYAVHCSYLLRERPVDLQQRDVVSKHTVVGLTKPIVVNREPTIPPADADLVPAKLLIAVTQRPFCLIIDVHTAHGPCDRLW